MVQNSAAQMLKLRKPVFQGDFQGVSRWGCQASTPFGQLAPNISSQHQYLTSRDRDSAVEYFPADLSAQVFWNVYNWFQAPPPYSRSPRWATSRATSPTLTRTVSNQISCCRFIEVPSNSQRRAADTVFPSYSPKLHNALPVCISGGSALKTFYSRQDFLWQSLRVF